MIVRFLNGPPGTVFYPEYFLCLRLRPELPNVATWLYRDWGDKRWEQEWDGQEPKVSCIGQVSFGPLPHARFEAYNGSMQIEGEVARFQPEGEGVRIYLTNPPVLDQGLFEYLVQTPPGRDDAVLYKDDDREPLRPVHPGRYRVDGSVRVFNPQPLR